MFKKPITFLIVLFSFLALVPSAYASTLYLSPGSASIPQGTIRSVSVGINTAGESVNGVSAYLSYPADKLEVAWVNYGSRFDIQAERSFGGGSIRISAGSISGVVGNVTVATIGFRGKALGQATVAFVGGSAAPRTSDSSDSLNLGASTGGTYTVVVPLPVTPTPTGGSGTELLISNVRVSDISTSSATITWETNEKSDSTVEYGLIPGKYFLSLSDQTLSATHTARLEGEALTPGATFHFKVKSKDKKDNEAVSSNYTFQLEGYNVKIRITDAENNPLPDTEVYLYSNPQRSRTDVNGEVQFSNVTVGKHLVAIKLAAGFEKTKEIEVLDSPLSQSFTVTVDTAESKAAYDTPLLIGLVALVVIIIIIVGVVVYFIKRRGGGTENPPIQAPQDQYGT